MKNLLVLREGMQSVYLVLSTGLSTQASCSFLSFRFSIVSKGEECKILFASKRENASLSWGPMQPPSLRSQTAAPQAGPGIPRQVPGSICYTLAPIQHMLDKLAGLQCF